MKERRRWFIDPTDWKAYEPHTDGLDSKCIEVVEVFKGEEPLTVDFDPITTIRMSSEKPKE
jgi:hypothetical protein